MPAEGEARGADRVRRAVARSRAREDEPQAVRRVYAGPLIRLDVESWGERELDVVHHPGAAAVLPLLPDGRAILVRQTRRAIRSELLEVPAGILDVDGEDAATTAARELFEETGYRHRTIELLGGVYSSAGFTDEYVHLFVAETDPEPAGEPEEGIELVRSPFAELVRSAMSGRFRDAKTALALLLADARRTRDDRVAEARR